MFFPSSGRGEAPGAPPAVLADPPVWWKPALALLAALLVQSSLAPFITVRGALPSFVLLVVLWYALRAGIGTGALFGAIAGACEDAFASTGAGWTISTGIVGALAGRTSSTALIESRLWMVAFAAGATLARYALFATILRIENKPFLLATMHVHAALWQSAFSALLAYLALTFVPRLGLSRVFFR